MAAATRKRISEDSSIDEASLSSESALQLETSGEEQQPRTAISGLRNFLSRSRAVPPTNNARETYRDGSIDENAEAAAQWQRRPRSRGRRWLTWLLWRLPIFILSCFGVLHLILVFLAQKNPFWDRLDYAPGWSKHGHPGEGLADYPTDPTRDVLPIPCHSHNDYWRRIPLFDALHWGCTSVEADVWRTKGTEDLLVGHSKSSLTRKRTFTNLYVDPLLKLLDNMNPSTEFANATGHGVFDEDPDQTLVLLVDFKTNGKKLWPMVQQRLQPLREKNYLSHWNGSAFNQRAITVVGTGNTPFDLLTANTTYRDIFFDAPLHKLYEPASNFITNTSTTYNMTNSYYASTSFAANIGLPYGTFSPTQLEQIRGQIRGAHARGLQARYWETPAWPTSLRNRVWQTLIDEGADVLNVDDLRAAASFDWRENVGHDWIDA